MKDIAFVILNYNIVYETVACVNSIIENIDTEQYIIIVVDNGSKKEIKDMLSSKLEGINAVVLHDLQQNIGFAKGNNEGIKIARKYNPKYVCCINNDTELIQKDYYAVLDSTYEKTGVAAIGPKVFLKDNSLQNFNGKLLSISEYQKQLKACEEFLATQKKLSIKRILKDLNIDKLFRKRKQNETNRSLCSDQYDVVLHGCWLIFTPAFFEFLQGFNEKTFLYREEELLYLSIRNKGLHTLYCSSLQIKHLEDVSTNTIKAKRSQKDVIYNQHQVNSLKVLICEMQRIKNDTSRRDSRWQID